MRIKARELLDLSIVLFVAVIFTIFSVSVNSIDRFYKFFQVYTKYRLLEIFVNLIFLSLTGLIWLSYRRWKGATKKQAELENIIDSINPDLLIVVDAKKNIVRCNASLKRMFGYEVDEVINQKADLLYFGIRSNSKQPQQISGTLESEGFNVELATGKRKDGTTIPLEIISGNLHGRGGTVLLLRDITERKRAEEEIKAAKTYAENIIANFLDTLIVTNPDGTIRTVNQATLDILGYKEEELINKPAGVIFEEEVKPFFTGTLEELAQKGVMRNYELTYVTKSGQAIPMSFNASLLQDEKGETMGLVAGAKDISKLKQEIMERKRAEEELRKSEKRYRELWDNAPVAYHTVDTKGIITGVNQTEAKMLGYTVEEMTGKSVFEFMLPEQRAEGRERFQLKLAGQELPKAENRILVRKDGSGDSDVYVSMEHVLEHNNEGKVIGMRTAMSDISDRKHLEAQLREAQKMEVVGQLAGGIAHDFNNILTVVQGFTEIALMKVKEDNPLYQDLERVQKAGRRAANLTRQLLLFSRRHPMEFTPLDLNQVLENLVEMLNHLIGEDISLITDLESNQRPINGDTGTIGQVITNLVINARDAMPEGGEITIKTEDVHVDKEYCETCKDARPGTFVCLSVQDTGVGIDQDTMASIFEPFFTTKEVGKGSGLGLSVVYGIVKQHEGWINVESSLGKGTTFRVYLPVIFTKPEEEQEEPVSSEAFKGKGERILSVEDEEPVREFTEKALSDSGHVVFSAANAQEALDIFEKEGGDFDLILCDVVLPDERGPKLVERLLKLKPGISVLFTSGYTSHKSDWHAVQEGGYSFIWKPYSLSYLVRAVSDALKKKRPEER